MEDWVKERAEETPSSEETTKPPFTLFGWDLYVIAFAALGGALVLFGFYWIFFSTLPMPEFCRAGFRNASICGWIDRSGRETSAPWTQRPQPGAVEAARSGT
jgi:hypothetical protein